MFALVFDDGVRAALPPVAPFTSDPLVLDMALQSAISASGRTALYDAVVTGLAYLDRGTHARKVLVIVSDGGDNASRFSGFDGTLQQIQASNVVIYTLALIDPMAADVSPRRLKAFADASGGQSFAPRDVVRVEDTMRVIANNIRDAYTLGYVSTNTSRDGRFRQVQVSATSPEGRGLSVRTRQGYVVEAE
jgi:Ca-activated chloride channel family protein